MPLLSELDCVTDRLFNYNSSSEHCTIGFLYFVRFHFSHSLFVLCSGVLCCVTTVELS